MNIVSKQNIPIVIAAVLLIAAVIFLQYPSTAAPAAEQSEGGQKSHQVVVTAPMRVAAAAEEKNQDDILRQKAFRAYRELKLDRHQNIYLKPFLEMAKQGSARKIKEGDVLKVEATGYDASVASTGDGDGITASLTQFRRGVAAVDPKVIPIGTILYVEGYGYARAEDVGGAIKGYKIDLAFPRRSDAFEWGRQHDVQVTVLAVPDLNKNEIEYPILISAL